jgi:hypothetical protein
VPWEKMSANLTSEGQEKKYWKICLANFLYRMGQEEIYCVNFFDLKDEDRVTGLFAACTLLSRSTRRAQTPVRGFS